MVNYSTSNTIRTTTNKINTTTASSTTASITKNSTMINTTMANTTTISFTTKTFFESINSTKISQTANYIGSFDPSTFPVLFQASFSLYDISLQMYVSILKSNYDVSDCIVNCSSHGLCKFSGNFTFICLCNQDYAGAKCNQSNFSILQFF